MKNDFWFQKWDTEFGKQIVESKVDKSSVNNVLAKRIWWILTQAGASLKICTLMSYFCKKYVMFELKKYTRLVWWKMTYGSKWDTEFSAKIVEIKEGKSSVNNVLAKGMYVLDECS